MMNEERIFFTSAGLSIEGLYAPGDGSKGVVVTHPHSQMGGSMENNVVEALVSSFHDRGYATLRFNFRGVGGSEGRFDDGEGEQDDVKGAIAFLQGKGLDDITLAGYSFGAWVISRAVAGHEGLSDIILVSPPVDFVPFDFSHLTGRCGLIICGDRDQFCPLPSLEQTVEQVGCRLAVIRGADHFYFGYEQDIEESLAAYLD